MENCTIYSHHLNFEKVVNLIKTTFPEAEFQLQDRDLEKAIQLDINGGLLSLQINYRQRTEPSYQLNEVTDAVTQQLAGIVGFIQSIPAQQQDIQEKFIHKVMSVNAEMSLMATPSFDHTLRSLIQQITTALDGFIFANPSASFQQSEVPMFLNPDFQLILDAAGHTTVQELDVKVESKYYDPPSQSFSEDQLERKARSESFLKDNQININQHLPCIRSEAEVELRSLNEVIERMYALLLITAYGEGVPKEHLAPIMQQNDIQALSPMEQSIYATDELTQQERVYATWRYEGLNLLVWVVGLVDELSYPANICDAESLVDLLLRDGKTALTKMVQLRSKQEILDELDETYRMHWACVDARLKGIEVGGDIDPGIVYERYYALNWLTQFQNQSWDDIQTPS